MSNPTLSILLAVDDDALRQHATRLLSQAGYSDLRACSVADTLAELDQRDANLLLIAEDTGLAMVPRVRLLDSATQRPTWILLLGAPGATLPNDTTYPGIDDLLPASLIDEQLSTRVHLGGRARAKLLRLGEENQSLRDTVAHLEQLNLVDTLTGLGNARYLSQKLDDSLRHIQARGGALCYLLIGLHDADALRHAHGTPRYNELVQGVGQRLQQMVRPLDVLARVDDHHFVLLTLPSSLGECAPSSFTRLHDGLNLQGFITSAGRISLHAGISLVGLDHKSLPIDPLSLFGEASRLLQESYRTGLVSARRLPARS